MFSWIYFDLFLKMKLIVFSKMLALTLPPVFMPLKHQSLLRKAMLFCVHVLHNNLFVNGKAWVYKKKKKNWSIIFRSRHCVWVIKRSLKLASPAHTLRSHCSNTRNHNQSFSWREKKNHNQYNFWKKLSGNQARFMRDSSSAVQTPNRTLIIIHRNFHKWLPSALLVFHAQL